MRIFEVRVVSPLTDRGAVMKYDEMRCSGCGLPCSRGPHRTSGLVGDRTETPKSFRTLLSLVVICLRHIFNRSSHSYDIGSSHYLFPSVYSYSLHIFFANKDEKMLIFELQNYCPFCIKLIKNSLSHDMGQLFLNLPFVGMHLLLKIL